MQDATVQQILETIDKYNETPKETIRLNIAELLRPYKAQQIADKTGTTIHAVYAWTKRGGNKPVFESAIRLCAFAGIGLEQLIK